MCFFPPRPSYHPDPNRSDPPARLRSPSEPSRSPSRTGLAGVRRAAVPVSVPCTPLLCLTPPYKFVAAQVPRTVAARRAGLRRPCTAPNDHSCPPWPPPPGRSRFVAWGRSRNKSTPPGAPRRRAEPLRWFPTLEVHQNAAHAMYTENRRLPPLSKIRLLPSVSHAGEHIITIPSNSLSVF
jgi:hypothetical protein